MAGAGGVPHHARAGRHAARVRAADLLAAFGDPRVRAVLATIGGDGAGAPRCCSSCWPRGGSPEDPRVLAGGVLLVETSEEVIPARDFGWILRVLGARGILAAVAAVVVAGVPFGHTRPRWILPYGRTVTVDGGQQRLRAHYS